MAMAGSSTLIFSGRHAEVPVAIGTCSAKEHSTGLAMKKIVLQKMTANSGITIGATILARFCLYSYPRAKRLVTGVVASVALFNVLALGVCFYVPAHMYEHLMNVVHTNAPLS